MFFGKITIENSLGNILAHTINVGDKKFSKGKVILKKDITHLKNNGFYSIICAVPDKNDIHEDKIAKLIGGKKTYIPKRPGEPNRSLADITKIKKDLKWKPKIRIEEGVKSLLNQIVYWKKAPVWTPKSIKKHMLVFSTFLLKDIFLKQWFATFLLNMLKNVLCSTILLNNCTF